MEAEFPTLHLVGRNGMHKYNNQDHAMMTAMLTAENILAGERKYDVWAVNEDAEYTESGYSGAQEALKSERLGAAQGRGLAPLRPAGGTPGLKLACHVSEEAAELETAHDS